MSVSINLDDIAFQDALRSKPVRDNFTDVQNAVNDLQTQIDAINTPASESEVVNARDYHTALRDRLRSASKAQGNVVITGGAVTQQASPNMTVAVAAGEALVDGVACKWASANSGTITAPVSNPRYDVVVVNSDSTLSIVAGSESATPVMPSWTTTQQPLALLILDTSTTSITTALIYDMRGMFSGKFSIFEYSGTWVKPAWCSKVRVIVVGGGSGGGAGGITNNQGGGGGGGGESIERILTVSSDTIITVGSKGLGQTVLENLGGTGGSDSSFGALTATGANGNSSIGIGGGLRGDDIATYAGFGGNGRGGGGGGGSISGSGGGGNGGNYYGASGSTGSGGGGNKGIGGGNSSGAQSDRNFGLGGAGGSGSGGGGGGGAGFCAAGGAGGAAGNVGQDGKGWGAGGGGGGSNVGGTLKKGGDGYQGVVIVEAIG